MNKQIEKQEHTNRRFSFHILGGFYFEKEICDNQNRVIESKRFYIGPLGLFHKIRASLKKK